MNEVQVDRHGFAATKPQQSATVGKIEADERADRALNAHSAAQAHLQRCQAAFNAADAAFKDAATARIEAAGVLDIARSEAENWRIEYYSAIEHARTFTAKPPEPTAQDLFPLINGGIAKVLPQPLGEIDRARQAAAPKPGGAYFEAQAAARSLTVEEQAENNYNHALTRWQIAGHKPGEEPQRAAYGLKPLASQTTNEPAAPVAKTEKR